MAKSIDTLNGIKSCGHVDLLDSYIRSRGTSDIEFSAAEIVGVDAAAFTAAAIRGRLEQIKASREQNARGIIGLLNEAHGLAINAAAAVGSNRVYSETARAKGLKSTRLTEFLAGELAVSAPRYRWATRGALRIFTWFGEWWPGTVTLRYERLSNSRRDPIHPLLFVELSDTDDFVNVQGQGGPFTGHGDVSEIPDAVEALMLDAQTVAASMIDDYARPPASS